MPWVSSLADIATSSATPSIRRRLLVLGLVFGLAPTLVSAADSAATKPPTATTSATAIPGDAQLEASGARIGQIEIVTVQIFDLSDPAQNKKLFRLADRLHKPTQSA